MHNCGPLFSAVPPLKSEYSMPVPPCLRVVPALLPLLAIVSSHTARVGLFIDRVGMCNTSVRRVPTLEDSLSA